MKNHAFEKKIKTVKVSLFFSSLHPSLRETKGGKRRDRSGSWELKNATNL
jgi:hypothetical protein